jgi:hypothetical protein
MPQLRSRIGGRGDFRILQTMRERPYDCVEMNNAEPDWDKSLEGQDR